MLNGRLNMMCRHEIGIFVCKVHNFTHFKKQIVFKMHFKPFLESIVESSAGYWLHSAVISSPHLFHKKLLACRGRCVTRSCICTQFANNLQTISSSWVHLSTGLPVTLTASRHAADWAFITSSRHSALMGCATMLLKCIQIFYKKIGETSIYWSYSVGSFVNLLFIKYAVCSVYSRRRFCAFFVKFQPNKTLFLVPV